MAELDESARILQAVGSLQSPNGAAVFGNIGIVKQQQGDLAGALADFEECKRKPRTYVLEDVCPTDEDPFIWVPMRYNDNTILLNLQSKAADLLTDVKSTEVLPSAQELFNRAVVAYPELMYLRGSPEEVLAAQTLRAFFLCCSGYSSTFDVSLEDDNPEFTFRCAPLLSGVKNNLLEFVLTNRESMQITLQKMETIVVCLLLHIVGRNEGFRDRFGCGEEEPEKVILAATEQCPEAVPSFGRLPQASKRIILAMHQAYFSFGSLMSAEAIPAHFLLLKEIMVPAENGLNFFLAVVAMEYIATQRTVPVPQESGDIIRLIGLCFPGVEKHSASKAYELYLRKRAERHQWRLMRDDFMHRAIIRLCCMSGSEDSKVWNEIQHVVEGMSDAEKEVLKVELGQKDGVASSPAILLIGGAELMAQAMSNPVIGLRPAVKLFCKLLEQVSDNCANNQSLQIKVHLDSLVHRAREFSGGAPFEDTALKLDMLGPAEIVVRS